jgi:transcriptional antiterminator RfaH
MTWVAVYTQTQAEALAVHHLERQKFDVYMPQYLKRRSHARQITWQKRPLFPRYIFVHLTDGSLWRKIRSTVGVSDLVLMGDKPATVDDAVIDEIRGREGDDGLVRLPDPAGHKAGDQVRITKPGLGDLCGIFEKQDDRDRVFVLLQFLGRTVRTRVRPSEVQGAF